MIKSNNPHRSYEDMPAYWREDALSTGEFEQDFRRCVNWCAKHGKVATYHRQAFGMSVEPYGLDLSSSGLDAEAATQALTQHAMALVAPAMRHWQWLYSKLKDEDSRILLLTVLAYRALGWKYVQMPLDSEAFWQCMGTLSASEKSNTPLANELQACAPYPMSLFDLNGTSGKVQLYSNAFGIFNEFIYSQYTLRSRVGVVRPNPGDVVLDCGACYGGTSLQFADAVGPQGTVVAYEFLPENIRIFEENVRINPELGARVKLMKRPVWTDSGVHMSIEGSGPATQVHIAKGDDASRQEGRSFESISIDDTVRELNLPRVDFIKMDIEGAEMMALRGAKRSIVKYRPNLAICVYHKLIDFYEIPQFIDSLGLGYEFSLQHSTVHGDETVVFATPKEGRPPAANFWPRPDLRWIGYKLKKRKKAS